MNPKSKKYYQELCQFNKQNQCVKRSKAKPQSKNSISKLHQNQSQKINNTLIHQQNKNTNNNCHYSVNHQGILGQKNQSKKSIILKQTRDLQNNLESRDKVLRLPKIYRQEQSVFLQRRRHSKSYKKMLTETNEINGDDSIKMRTLSPKQSMKQLLLNIVKNKQNRNLISIDQYIDKLEVLTKRYSCLRKDLAIIQQDILTINLKHKMQRKQKQTSQQNSLVFK